MGKPKQHNRPLNDLRPSLTPLDPNHTLIIVIEVSQMSWLGAGMLPGVERPPLKKIEPNENELLKLLHRWRKEADGCRPTARFAQPSQVRTHLRRG
jgi:hypothetical protein